MNCPLYPNMRRPGIALLSGVAIVLMILTFVVIPTMGRDRTALSRGPSLIEIQRLVRLSVVKISVSFVQEARSEGRLGTLHGIWLIHGNANMVVDLDRVEIVSRDETARTATIRLATPRVDAPRIDHERTQLYDLAGNWTFGTSSRASLQTQAMRQAEMTIRREAMSSDSVRLAIEQTENIIRQLYAAAGWDVAVEWASAD